MSEAVLITGGAGFVGANLGRALLERGDRVIVLDNFSREGSRENLAWLREQGGSQVRVEAGDVRDRDAVRRSLRDAAFVYHFAAQVAVTKSLENPRLDFEVNALGTLTLLEELRQMEYAPGLLFTSTNKVYGGLEDIGLHAHWNRYEPDDWMLARTGIGERRPLDFRSPYGCSKGAADQYVLDYARNFGLKTTVFRMSCIYGPRQFGNEDQGWLAHFLIRALSGEPITVYGDGKQVRDALFVGDLVKALLAAREKIELVKGRAFNIGGGPRNTVSLVEVIQLIRHLCGSAPRVVTSGWRAGDQRYYVSDCSEFEKATGWKPVTGVQEGMSRLHEWLVEAMPAVHAAREAG